MLIIGHHILYGKIVNLDKPLLVLKKEKMNCQSNLGDGENGLVEMEVLESNSTSSSNTEYHVQAIIRKKILFNKRPRPIVIADAPRKK
jgi:chromosome transmission fidelity protein 8